MFQVFLCSIIMQNLFLQKFGNGMMYWGTFESSHKKISEWYGVTLRSVLRTQKEMDVFTCDYEGSASRKPFSNLSDKQSLPTFCWNLGHDWQRSQQVIQLHCQRYERVQVCFLSGWLCMNTLGISHTRWEWTNFYHRPWRTWGKFAMKKILKKSVHPLHRICFAFSQKRIICSVSDGKHTE